MTVSTLTVGKRDLDRIDSTFTREALDSAIHSGEQGLSDWIDKRAVDFAELESTANRFKGYATVAGAYVRRAMLATKGVKASDVAAKLGVHATRVSHLAYADTLLFRLAPNDQFDGTTTDGDFLRAFSAMKRDSEFRKFVNAMVSDQEKLGTVTFGKADVLDALDKLDEREVPAVESREARPAVESGEQGESAGSVPTVAERAQTTVLGDLNSARALVHGLDVEQLTTDHVQALEALLAEVAEKLAACASVGLESDDEVAESA